MTAVDYTECLRRLLVHEGGYTNDPLDAGGPTNFGITIYDYRKYVKPGATAEDVRRMDLSDAMAVYKSEYWATVRGDDLPAGVDDTVFDYGVNSGIGRARKVLQRCVGVKADGRIDQATLDALAKRDPIEVIHWINSERLAFLQSLKTWDHFGKGWGARVVEVEAFSKKLAERAKTEGPAPKTPVPLPAPKPEVQTAGKGAVPQHPAAKAIAKHGTKGGIVAVGGSAVSFHDWLVAHPYEATAVGIGIGAAIAGVAYVIERNHKSKQEAAVPGLVPVPAK